MSDEGKIVGVKRKSRRGFARLTPEQREAVSRKGGKISQASGAGHRFTTEQARAAGRKGGRPKKEKPAQETNDKEGEKS